MDAAYQGVWDDVRGGETIVRLPGVDGVAWRGVRGARSLWFVASAGADDVVALRVAPPGVPVAHIQCRTDDDGTVRLEFGTPLGAVRATVTPPIAQRAALRCTIALIPHDACALGGWARDAYARDAGSGVVYTQQRGLRTGIVYASCELPVPASFFYLQDFSSLNDFFEATGSGPADTVSAAWPAFGYVPPATAKLLPAAREFVVSDAYLIVSPGIPPAAEIGGAYLDLLADAYLALERPPVVYHDWPARAAQSLRDLTLSPLCTYERQGRRFVMPYVGDEAKPPESMVQFTVGLNALEYDRWRGETSALATLLTGSTTAFFEPAVGSVVRWLPGEPFDAQQAEALMTHDAMDSWYLYHALFNTLRLAAEGDADAGRVGQASMDYAVRVAQRFDYRWPVFFSLRTLDVLRAEAAPGRGGERDVAGLYALVMLHAHELYGDDAYLREAEAALTRLEGLGFDLAYQLNTTGFAAEAAHRMWKRTRERRYLHLSEMCMANLFDNMWIWRSSYGHAAAYQTFFGLFPLRDAPYLAPYEELEAHAKFHEYLAFGGEDVRPSLRLLLAEFQKYGLSRSASFYADALPREAVADAPRNGRIARSLAVPLEDLRDGRDVCGQVGQEIYGAGLAFVLTSRHYMHLPGALATAFADYPMFDFAPAGDGSATWRAAGDPRGRFSLRVIPRDVDAGAVGVRVTAFAGDVRYPVRGTISPEGHAVYELAGGQRVEVAAFAAASGVTEGALVIGTLAAS